MPKIPTFTAEGSIEQFVGTTSNIKINPDANIFSALKPVTDAVVQFKIKENDAQNKTEALKLENDFITDMQKVYDEVNVLENKEIANQILKTKSNALIEKHKATATNGSVQSLFNNYALSEVQKGIFRTNTQISKNILTSLDNNVALKENRLLTTAFLAESNFDYNVLKNDLINLYTTNFKGKIPNANLSTMINNIPSTVQGFRATKDIYDNPSFAYTELKKGKNSSVYPDLKVEQRIKLIHKVETMMVQPLQKEFANVVFSLQDKGTEQPFDFNFAKKILPPEKYNELKKTYDLAKINAEDVRLIRTLSLSEADDLIESKNFNTDLYVGSADRITQAKLKQGLIKVRNNVQKQMLEDPVNFQIETSPEIAELANDYRMETNPDVQLANRKILTDALIDDQIRRGTERANLKILTKQEVIQIKNDFLNTSIKSEDKLKLKEQLKVNYGYENMGMILNHLQDEKTSETILMAIATDSVELAKDLFNSSTLQELQDRANQKEAGQVASLQKLIAKKTEDFGQVLDSQGEGSESIAAKMNRINEALLKVALVRMDKNTSAEDTVTSAANDFLSDYVINNALTALTPKKINKIDIPTAGVANKAEAILIGIKDTSPGNYLDRFMGEDGYMHYASSLNIPNLTEEQVKKRVAYTIRNHSKWLNNSDMTGMVLYADFSSGLQPVINSDNQRVEFYFTKLPNQDPTIKDTISVYPVTGDELPLIPDPPSFDYMQYDEFLIDETIDDGKKNSKIPVNDQSSIFKTIGNAIISPLAAAEMDNSWRQNEVIQKIIKEEPIIEKIIMAESSGNAATPDSKDGARGLMQIMKNTAELDTGFGVNYNLSYEELSDPEKNVKYGAKYYKGLKKYYGNDRDALIAYNWGHGNYQSFKKLGYWIEKKGKKKIKNYKLPEETRNYLKKILGVND